MSDKGKVWVLTTAEDELDTKLFEELGVELEDEGVVELHDPSLEDDEPSSVAERLRQLVSEQLGSSVVELTSALTKENPDVVITSRPDDMAVLASIARRGGPRPIRIGVVRVPVVGTDWLKSAADILAVADAFAADTAKKRENAVRVTGVPVGSELMPAENAPAAREELGLDPEAHVLFVPAGTIEPDDLTQLMIQMGLVRVHLDVVFEVDDAAEAELLRKMVPAHGVSALLVPAGELSAPFWSLAHLVFARANYPNHYRARATGVPLLVSPPRGRVERTCASGLVQSGTGRRAESMATLAVDIDLSLEPERFEAMVERQLELAVDSPGPRFAEVVLDALRHGPEQMSESAGMPTELERIGRAAKKRRAPSGGIDEAVRAATEVREKGEFWDRRARLARKRGEEDLALEADKRAAHHRRVLERLLGTMRSEKEEDEPEEHDVEDELESLRRKAEAAHSVEERLSALEVEDELRELKDRLERE